MMGYLCSPLKAVFIKRLNNVLCLFVTFRKMDFCNIQQIFNQFNCEL